MRALLAALACLALALFARSGAAVAPPSVSDAAILGDETPALLSAFGLFGGAADKPSQSLISYTLATPLFTDYAEKQRFIYMPKGRYLNIGKNGEFIFPIGTALVKSFGYPDATGKLRIIETRLLLNRKNGWVALPYVWRADGKDADLKLGGARMPVAFTKPGGSRASISYAVPNKNQCKQCHSDADAIVPIGTRYQNMRYSSEADKRRLFDWVIKVKEGSLPLPIADAAWNDPTSGSVEARSLAYLRINCGHCHKPTGSASNSGLFFDGKTVNPTALGIGKRPVAAGRGSGNFDFVIDPGNPERSILIYRLKSTDPGIAMPEVGRATVHKEGAELLEQWIREMKP